jgi:hypothetical protein
MKAKYFKALSLIGLTFLLSETGLSQTHHNTAVVEEERNVSAFHSLEASGLAEVFLAKGQKETVSIKVSGMPVEDLIVEVQDNVLKVRTKGSHNGENVKVYVTYCDLKSIAVSGASTLQGDNTIEAKALNVTVGDAGSATIDVDVSELTIAMHDAGDLNISGKADNQKILSLGDQGTLNNDRLRLLK